MTTSGSTRRIVVGLTIGSFSLAALMGVLALLGTGDFGDTEARVLLTTLTVGITSVAVLCYLATSETRYAPVGVAGGVAVLLPLSTALWLIWVDTGMNDSDVTWKAFGVGVVVAATLAQVSLLLVLAGSRAGLRPLLGGTLVLATILAVLVSTMILGADGSDGLWRVVGIVAILDVLGTVVTMALAVFGGARRPSPVAGSRAVDLPASLVGALEERAHATGRSCDDLVAEAVAGYLAGDGLRVDSGPDAPH